MRKNLVSICFMLLICLMAVVGNPGLGLAEVTAPVFTVDFEQPLYDIKLAGQAILLIVVVIFGFGIVKGMVGKR